MAQQVINIGTSPNDGTGDQLRTAFDKCNDNFTELYASSLGDLQQVTDIGATTTNAITTGNLTINEGGGGDPCINTNQDLTDGSIISSHYDTNSNFGISVRFPASITGNQTIDYPNSTGTIATQEWVIANPSGDAVDSVNGQTGVVVLDATDVDALQRDGSNANSNINIGEYELKAGQFTLDTSPTGTAAVGTTRWNDTLGSTETTLKGGSVILKNGVDLVARVVNKVTPNATLTKAAYQAVRVSGAQGQRLAVAYAQANNDNNSADTIGLVCETIATNQEGFILTVGQLEGINTTGSLQGETWADGDVLYLSPTTAGRITNVKPTGATGHIVIIGYVEYAHAINGKIYVKVMNGWELDELHNVNISSPTNNQILAYTSSNQNWENKSLKSIEGLGLIGSTDLEYYNNLFFEQNLGYMIPSVGSLTYVTLRSTNSISMTGQTADFNFPARVLFASSTTIGNFATQRGTVGGTYSLVTSAKFYFKRRFQIDSNISGSRFVCGLSNQFSLAAPTNVEPDTLINTLGVCKLSTSNNLHIFYNDATGLATTVDLGVNYPANNVTAYFYDLEIYKDSGTANLTIKVTRIDASGNRISTNQVINTNYNTLVNYNPVVYGTNNATAAAFRFFDFGIIFKNYNLQWDTI